MRDGSLQLVAHGGAAYSLHAPAVLEPTDNEAEWLVRGGRAAGEIAVFEFDDDDRVRSYELGAFVWLRNWSNRAVENAAFLSVQIGYSFRFFFLPRSYA